jgi:hypothetical protein
VTICHVMDLGGSGANPLERPLIQGDPPSIKFYISIVIPLVDRSFVLNLIVFLICLRNFPKGKIRRLFKERKRRGPLVSR